MTQQLITPEPPDPLLEESRLFWRELGRNMIHESIGAMDETGKQIIAVAGILEGLYFHAIAFSELQAKVTGAALFIYLAPVALLLVSLIFALLIFFPERSKLNIHSSEASRLIYEHTVQGKLNALRLAALFLVLGILAILFAALAYLKG